MEFLPGGDLMTMLIKYDTFSEDVTRFYMAQCVLAIDAVERIKTPICTVRGYPLCPIEPYKVARRPM